MRRTHAEIRWLILSHLSDEPLAIREIALASGTDWYTTERHLNYMKGRGLVEEVFRHKLLRLFRITTLGKELLFVIQNKKESKNRVVHALQRSFER